MGTKGARRKITSTLSILHPNTNPYPNPNSDPQVELGLGSEVVLGSKVESNDVVKGSHEQHFEGLV